MRKHFLAATITGMLLLFVACGGGGGGGSTVGNGGATLPPVIVPPAPVIAIMTSALPGATSGLAYSTTLSGMGGTLPYKWAALNLTLPQGFTLSPDGVLSGTYPTSTGGITTNIQIQLVDSAPTPNVTVKTLALDVFGFRPDKFFSVPQVNVDFWQQGFVQAIGGVDPIQWQLSGTLPPGMSFVKSPPQGDSRQFDVSGKPTQTGTYTFTITATDSGSPVRAQSKTFTLQVEPAQLQLVKSPLPVAVVGQPYSYSFATIGGMAPFQWSFTSNGGSLPGGLTFNSTTGILSGVPTVAGYLGFQVALSDSSTPNRQSDSWSRYWLLVSPTALSLRNDSIATAVPIYLGTYDASISPLTDTSGSVSADQDYYKLTSLAGSTISLVVTNQVFKPDFTYHISLLDPVIEIIDANGHRYSACNDPLDDNPPSGAPIPVDTTPNGFDDPCMNWSGDGTTFGVSRRASLNFKVPGSTGNTTFYIHVFDWRGDARPDMFYQLSVTQQ